MILWATGGCDSWYIDKTGMNEHDETHWNG